MNKIIPLRERELQIIKEKFNLSTEQMEVLKDSNLTIKEVEALAIIYGKDNILKPMLF